VGRQKTTNTDFDFVVPTNRKRMRYCQYTANIVLLMRHRRRGG